MTLTGGNEGLLVDIARTYAIGPGLPLRGAPCLICHAPLQGKPAVLHVLVTLAECGQGDGHILAGAAFRHAACVPYNDRTLTHALERILIHAETD